MYLSTSILIHVDPRFEQFLVLLDLVGQRAEHAVDDHHHVEQRPLRLYAVELLQFALVVVPGSPQQSPTIHNQNRKTH